MRVQPEIKMADVKPETLKPDIADGICVKFQRKPVAYSPLDELGDAYENFENLGYFLFFRYIAKPWSIHVSYLIF